MKSVKKSEVRKEKAHDLKKRKAVKKTKPGFKRQEGFKHAKLKDSWRKPKGRHSKLRKREKARGSVVKIGYGSPAAVRGLNRLGYSEVMVSNTEQIGKLDPRSEMAVISGTVGKRKKELMIKTAVEKKIKVSNA